MPYYWAGFVFNENNTPIDFASSKNNNVLWTTMGIVVVVIILAVYLIFRFAMKTKKYS